MNGTHPVDCIYVAASWRDARYTRICVASLRHFYPEIPIRLLAGGRLERGLEPELRHYWDVERADVAAGEYGWGFVKLEPLFGAPGERFLVLDSDTVITSRVLDALGAESAPFVVDAETQSEADAKRLYYDWDRLRQIEPAIRAPQRTSAATSVLSRARATSLSSSTRMTFSDRPASDAGYASWTTTSIWISPRFRRACSSAS